MRHTVVMTDKPRKDSREDRLARQLRANLARRKAQARAKRAGEEDARPEGLPTVPTSGEPVSGQGSGEDG